MNGQPDAAQEGQRSYALEGLRTARNDIIQLTQALVIWRGKVESCRAQDLAAARDAYDILADTRKQLADALGGAQLLLMEAEDYPMAAQAGQLKEGLLGFDLMSSVYRPVYDALTSFAARLPVDGTTNAQVVGRLMNNIKMGYYPTDPDNISLILKGVQFPEGVATNLLDPCCGCGKALRQIADGNNCFTYGVELDGSRADEAQTRLHRAG